jgi:hypothetical protein
MWKWLSIAALVYGLLGLWAIFGHARRLGTVPPDLPSVIDFENQEVRFMGGQFERAQVIAKPDGNHLLRWVIHPAEKPLHMLGLHARMPEGANGQLSATWRASLPCRLYLGLVERDGSVYHTTQHAGPEARTVRLPVQEMLPSERSPDENRKLDLAQITGVVVVYINEGPPRRGIAQIEIELDDIKLE